MKVLKCKECNTEITILPEWDQSNATSIRVKCPGCGKAYRYKPLKNRKTANSGSSADKQNSNTQEGTTVLDKDKSNSKNSIKLSARLDAVAGPSENKGITIKPKAQPYFIFIGRKPNLAQNGLSQYDEDYIISDDYVSRIHIKLYVKKNSDSLLVTLEDVGSSNGTKVDDALIKKGDCIILANNNIIEIGDTKLKFVYE